MVVDGDVGCGDELGVWLSGQGGGFGYMLGFLLFVIFIFFCYGRFLYFTFVLFYRL